MLIYYNLLSEFIKLTQDSTDYSKKARVQFIEALRKKIRTITTRHLINQVMILYSAM